MSVTEEAKTLCGCYACQVEWTADDPPECRKQRIARALSERDAYITDLKTSLSREATKYVEAEAQLHEKDSMLDALRKECDKLEEVERLREALRKIGDDARVPYQIADRAREALLTRRPAPGKRK